MTATARPSLGAGTDRAPFWSKRPERVLSGLAPYPIDAHLLDTVACVSALWAGGYLSARLRRLIAEAVAGGDDGRARAWVELAAGLHDCGKATAAFETRPWLRSRTLPWLTGIRQGMEQAGMPLPDRFAAQILANAGGGSLCRRHEMLGMGVLSGARGRDFGTLSSGDSWLPLTVGGHHGVWRVPGAEHSPLDTVLRDAPSGGWGVEQRRLIDLVSGACGVHPDDAPTVSGGVAGVVTVLITGIVQLADWLASDDRVVTAGLDLLDGQVADSADPAWVACRREELREHVARSLGRYEAPSDPHRVALAVVGDEEVPALRPLQADAHEVSDGLWFVAYPTAEGKTGAALLRHMVERDEGLIFALPTRATTDAMQGRLERSFATTDNTVLLSHQYASLHRRPETEGHGFDWYTTATRRLLAPVVAATCDQVLAGALPQRHAALRLLALANHHVVLDEVHTYDQFQIQLLAGLMSWWGATGTRVTVLSATLPRWQQRILAEAYAGAGTAPDTEVYPAHWVVRRDRERVLRTPPLTAPVPDVQIRTHWTDDATAAHCQWAVAQHATFPRCDLAVIRSTIDETIATAHALQRTLPADIDLRVLHSRMTLAHRAQIEGELLTRLGPQAPRARPLAVVSSQVLDVSLELSLWLMSSDLAPAASLVQRIGRLWRFHARMIANLDPSAPRPGQRELNVVVRTRGGVIDDRVARPYFASELSRVATWIGTGRTLRIPEDVQAFVDETAMDLMAGGIDITGAAAEFVDQAHRHEQGKHLAGGLSAVATARRPVALPKLAAVTSASPVTDDLELATRYSTTPSESFLLVGGEFGARLPVSALRSTTDTDLVRDAMRGVVPVSGGGVLQRAKDASKASCADWRPAHHLLTHLHPLDIDCLADHGFTYDATFGLTSTTSEGAS